MRTMLTLATVLTTATPALAGGPKMDATTGSVVAALATLVAINVALYLWRRR